MKTFRWILIILGLLSLGTWASTQSLSHSEISVERADHALQIDITMQKGWYTYGQDPGELGQAVTVEWQNIQNKFGDLEHPESVVKNEGGFLVNVIKEQGVWSLPILKDFELSQDVMTVSYLVCKDICVPQKAVFTLDLSEQSTSLTVLKAILFAFLGGVFLNIMPCVFPVLFLKVLSLSKAKDYDTRERALAAVGYTLGIVLTFIGLALVLWILKWLGLSVGWGFHLQSAPFVLGLAILFILVSLNLAGFLEVPATVLSGFGKWSNRIAKTDTNHIVLSNINTGILATLVATPCTAPLMAPAIGYAFTVSLVTVVLTFTALGMGMAFPYIVAVMSPTIADRFPKPGQWMETAKKVMAIPMGVTSLWLLWVVKGQVHISLFVVISAVLVSGIYWVISRHRPLVKVGVVSSILVLGAVMSWNLKLLSLEETGSGTVEQIERYRNEGQRIFVDVTADWCLSCKANELLVINTNEIQEFFDENNVKVVVLDWTQYDEDITRYLESFQRNGVPLYVVYLPGKEPVVLPQLLTVDTVKNSIRNK